tara:strand:+ start:1141 stop:5640 length:4500 start_codon:yes stop_codon:yes gene_type:complete
MRIIFTLFFIISLAFSSPSNFIIKEGNGIQSIIEFNIGDISIDDKEGYHIISSSSKGNTQNIGQPELPSYTFSYAIDYNTNYSVTIEENDYILYNNIDLYPSQPIYNVNQDKIFIKDDLMYSKNTIYPSSKISSKRASLRGYDLLTIELVPYEYNAQTKELKVFNNIDVIITESGLRDAPQRAPRSRIFESMYNNSVINSEDYSDSRSFQKPSILYICGGNLSTSPYLDPLIEWRHKQGYVVNVVSSDEAGTSTTNIKNYILNAYNNWENPPEHVCFIGDANGSIYVSTYTVYGGSGWSTASGEGDFPYSLLEGNDLLPEVTLGRISIRSTTELITAINKIIGYEKNYADDSEWLNAIALVGDPNNASGISTVITNQYIEQIAQIHGGMTDIRTKYTGSTDYDDWMRNQINDGIAYLNYRGIYGFSGFTTSDVNQLNNGYKLPFIVTITCGTGSFGTETTCISESLYRAGTSVSPKGAVAVVGTAQSYTHTAFNNIVDMGIFESILLNGVKTAGEATVYGKIALNEIYPQNPNDNVYLFSTWNTLFGDPALQLWTSPPQNMVVQHDQMVINGSNSFQVTITNQSGIPIEGVAVTLSEDYHTFNGIFETQYTNSNGIADFILPDSMDSGNVNVTSIKQNYMPDESFFIFSNDLPEVQLNNNSIIVNDSSGNDDGILNPGETVLLSMQIDNVSGEQIEGSIIASITSNSDYITLSNNENIALGNFSSNMLYINNISVQASNNMSNMDNPMLKLEIYSTSDDLLWNYVVPIDFSSANLDLSYNLSNLTVGSSSDISLVVNNSGTMPLTNLVAEINMNNNLLTFSPDSFLFDYVGAGQSSSSNNTIIISSDDSLINGSIISVPISLSSDNGYELETLISIQVGSVTVNDPVGPDLNGYYIYDMGDTGYQLAPDYDWIEIDPDYGGNGDEVNVYDGGDNQDDVTTIPLPFEFTFYGVDYNEVSVCSNGWISFGSTDMVSFRNYTLPGPGGPSPIVAVFWDDLKTTNGGEIYSYHDVANDAFIIEWSNLRTFLSNSTESFQVILYNTGNETPTGDDEIKLQFKDFNNTSIGDYPVGNYNGPVIHGQYSTVGIENHLGNDGLQYTFNNSYANGARVLTDESALFITTRGSIPYAQPEASYNINEFVFNVPLNEEDSENLIITNIGELGSNLVYELSSTPYPVTSNQIDGFGYAWAGSIENEDVVNYDWIDISDNYTALEFENNDTATEINIGFDFSYYGNSYSQCFINPNGWIGFIEDDDGWNNQSLFSEETPNGSIFGFWDDLNPANSGNDVGTGVIKYHSDGQRLVVWFDNVIHWTDFNRIYDFQIVIYKTGQVNLNYQSMLGTTESATVGIKSPSGLYGLEVVHNGPFIEDNLSISFNTSNWLSVDFLSGNNQLSNGESAIYSIDVNTNNLEQGTYEAFIINNTNAINDFDLLSVTLNTQSSFLLGDLNQDGILDIIDVVSIVSIIMGNSDPSSLDQLLADLNQDGAMNVQDIILLVGIILSN